MRLRRKEIKNRGSLLGFPLFSITWKNYFGCDMPIALDIAPAAKYPRVVIPAKAGIQKNTGYRIKSGMTELAI
jgi:hypothetical protein